MKRFHAQINHVTEDGKVLTRLKELGNDGPTLVLGTDKFDGAAPIKGERFVLDVDIAGITEGGYLHASNAKIISREIEVAPFDVDAYLASRTKD